jgi:hypothetical protein
VATARQELRDLVERLPNDLVDGALQDVRLRLRSAPSGDWPPKWFALGPSRSGRADLAERVDEALAEGFGR